MKIAKNSVVVMHYAVSDSEGTLIDSSYEDKPMAIIQGTGYLIPGLDNALIDHQVGDTFEVAVACADAYGERHDDYVQTVPREVLSGVEDLALGTQLRATTDEGEQTVIVIDVQDDVITVDGNHPLAGLDLSFDVEIIEVREATEEELAHGHVHEKSCCDTNKEESCCDKS
ncbi:peptidylprolyl isomerase [Colwellia sp. E2M01]|uniref:FKBP-type peptidyl-prolyl cis-trans isomerase n=1 Tax=Colwellia sp. E2M01 TaxID=2841561 RepID=UPI001C08CC68|nr:peptidylprolyl isomerase [Colwellia sp. E2M01]MBU2869624.1 peptidylprolyl isomerase [Colwellia sp. E2M01]